MSLSQSFHPKNYQAQGQVQIFTQTQTMMVILVSFFSFNTSTNLQQAQDKQQTTLNHRMTFKCNKPQECCEIL